MGSNMFKQFNYKLNVQSSVLRDSRTQGLKFRNLSADAAEFGTAAADGKMKTGTHCISLHSHGFSVCLGSDQASTKWLQCFVNLGAFLKFCTACLPSRMSVPEGKYLSNIKYSCLTFVRWITLAINDQLA